MAGQITDPTITECYDAHTLTEWQETHSPGILHYTGTITPTGAKALQHWASATVRKNYKLFAHLRERVEHCDLESECVITGMKAFEKYRADKKAKLSSWVIRCMHCRLIDYAESINSSRKRENGRQIADASFDDIQTEFVGLSPLQVQEISFAVQAYALADKGNERMRCNQTVTKAQRIAIQAICRRNGWAAKKAFAEFRENPAICRAIRLEKLPKFQWFDKKIARSSKSDEIIRLIEQRRTVILSALHTINRARKNMSNNLIMDGLLGPVELAEMFQCAEQTICRMVNDGRLVPPDMTLGNKEMRWRPKTIEFWFDCGCNMSVMKHRGYETPKEKERRAKEEAERATAGLPPLSASGVGSTAKT